ncbi:hypothetical protein ACOZ38_19895 [Sphaerisporangium viridialbum]|uniref:hypothetical protein n=1 Tax=Sphaerisporangium viridialbum TaxID=46189 RepID=UPI003C74F0AF
MRGIRMPSEQVLPDGPHRRFLAEVFQKYRAAGRPPLRDIVAKANRMDLPGSASQETIRRVLKGAVIPQRWETAYAVYAPLCALADIDPDVLYWDGEGNGYNDPDQITHKELFKRLWSAAFDDEASDLLYPTLRIKVPPPKPPSNNPWGNGLSLADEPPF